MSEFDPIEFLDNQIKGIKEYLIENKKELTEEKIRELENRKQGFVNTRDILRRNEYQIKTLAPYEQQARSLQIQYATAKDIIKDIIK